MPLTPGGNILAGKVIFSWLWGGAGGGSKEHLVQDDHLLLAVAVGGVVGTGVEAGGLSDSNESSSLL